MADNASDVQWPAARLGVRRTARSLRRHTPNTKAEICSRRRKTDPEKSGTRARSRALATVICHADSFHLSLLSWKQEKQFRLELRKFQRRDRAARMYHHVPSQGNLLTMQSQYLAHAPSDSVSHHRVAQRLLDAYSKAVSWQSVTPRENHERRTRTPPSLTIDRVVFRASYQPPFARQVSFRQRLSEGFFFVHVEC